MSPIAITLTLLVLVIILFVTEKLPLAVTSMIALMVLVLTGVLSPKDAFAGFVDSNLILFVAMFVIGGAFFETGMANKVGGIVTRFAKTERQLIVSVMLVTGIMSGFLSNTGTAAILIPVVIGIASKSGFARSRLLLPLIFAAAMGGNLSIIGAPGNLLGKSALEAVGQDISFFEYGYVGLPILLIGTLFFATVGYRFLPDHQGKTGESIYDKAPDFSQVPPAILPVSGSQCTSRAFCLFLPLKTHQRSSALTHTQRDHPGILLHPATFHSLLQAYRFVRRCLPWHILPDSEPPLY